MIRHIETEFKRMNILQSILKCVRIRNHPSQKPRIFPIASLEEVDNFENIDENAYSDVVNYFRYIGGFNLKEAINLYLKEFLEDSLTPPFTWFGREGDQRALYYSVMLLQLQFTRQRAIISTSKNQLVRSFKYRCERLFEQRNKDLGIGYVLNVCRQLTPGIRIFGATSS